MEVNRFSFVWMAPLLGCAGGALAVILVDHAFATPAVAGALLIFTGIFLSAWVRYVLASKQSTHMAPHERPESNQDEYLESLETLCSKIFPILSLHIKSSLLESETSITNILNQTSSIALQLAEMMQATSGDYQTPGNCEGTNQNSLCKPRANIKHLRGLGENVRSEIDEILVYLQFQDRVSQILRNVTINMDEVVHTIETCHQKRIIGEAVEPVDVAEMLKRIHKTYTTTEERLNHEEKSVHTMPTKEISELTFF